jgi:hypothetical protein
MKFLCWLLGHRWVYFGVGAPGYEYDKCDRCHSTARHRCIFI